MSEVDKVAEDIKKSGNEEDAKEFLNTYLEIRGNATDKAHATSMIQHRSSIKNSGSGSGNSNSRSNSLSQAHTLTDANATNNPPGDSSNAVLISQELLSKANTNIPDDSIKEMSLKQEQKHNSSKNVIVQTKPPLSINTNQAEADHYELRDVESAY